MILLDIFCVPFGILLRWLYIIGKDYGVALILFTMITRVLLFPLAIKQQKSTAEMIRMRPKLEKLQKKYAKNKEKFNEATMQLYQEEGYSPLTGCLPMLIQLPILSILYFVIYQPPRYILGLKPEIIDRIADIAKISRRSYREEIDVAQFISQHMDKLTGIIPSNTLRIKFDFFGLNLLNNPQFKFNILLLIPILCYITSFLSSWLSMKMNSAANTQQTKGMNNSMLFVMPLISTYFAFQVPAALGFYWIITNIFMILQVILLNKFYNPEKLADELEQKSIERKRKRGIVTEDTDSEEETVEQPEDKKVKNDQSQKADLKPEKVKQVHRKSGKMSQKEIKEMNRKRLAASRAAEKKRIEEKNKNKDQ